MKKILLLSALLCSNITYVMADAVLPEGTFLLQRGGSARYIDLSFPFKDALTESRTTSADLTNFADLINLMILVNPAHLADHTAVPNCILYFGSVTLESNGQILPGSTGPMKLCLRSSNDDELAKYNPSLAALIDASYSSLIAAVATITANVHFENGIAKFLDDEGEAIMVLRPISAKAVLLDGTYWQLGTQPGDTTEVYDITFNLSQGILNFETNFCSHYFGTLTQQEDRLTFAAPLLGHRIPGCYEQDVALGKLSKLTADIEIDGDKLRLVDENGNSLLEFDRTPKPAESVTGTVESL